MNHIQSPDTSDAAIEREIQSKAVAPRITPADIEANIVAEYSFTAATATRDCPQHESLPLLTFCVLVLANGFTVTGESAPASPENFDAEIGRKIARQNAVQKIWPLMGYALKQQLHDAQHAKAPPDFRDRVRAEHAELADRLGKLTTFIGTDPFLALPLIEQEALQTQAEMMAAYAMVLVQRIGRFPTA